MDLTIITPYITEINIWFNEYILEIVFGSAALMFFLLIRGFSRFRHWVFCKSGFAQAKQLETLSDHPFLEREGYLYITDRMRLFRLDCRLDKEFQKKKEALRLELKEQNPGIIGITENLEKTLYPLMLNQKEAKSLNLDLRIARHDALIWWKTGYFKLRPTPEALETPATNEDNKNEGKQV